MRRSIILIAAAALATAAAPDLQSLQTSSKRKRASVGGKVDAAAEVEVLGLALARPGADERAGSDNEVRAEILSVPVDLTVDVGF